MHESGDVISVFREYEDDKDEYPRVMMSIRSFTTKVCVFCVCVCLFVNGGS